jgi:hypothetical protein
VKERRKEGRKGKKEGSCTYKSVFVTAETHRYLIATVLREQVNLESQAREVSVFRRR